jgi:hypothetical protein
MACLDCGLTFLLHSLMKTLTCSWCDFVYPEAYQGTVQACCGGLIKTKGLPSKDRTLTGLTTEHSELLRSLRGLFKTVTNLKFLKLKATPHVPNQAGCFAAVP